MEKGYYHIDIRGDAHYQIGEVYDGAGEYFWIVGHDYPIHKSDIKGRIEKVEYKPLHPKKWISVKDTLPDNDGRYLVFMNRGLKQGEIRIGDPPFHNKIEIFRYYVTAPAAGWTDKVPCWDARGWAGDLTKYITHWMPLPEPPRTGAGSLSGTEVPGQPGLYYL